MAFKAIVGLGNPAEYENTYHNAGKAFVQYLAEGKECIAKKSTFTIYRLENGLSGVLLGGFMNESGPAAAAAISYFKIKPEEIILAHDDSDLPLGTFKLEPGRGAAGHHGVESVMQSLGTKNFMRLRIGIRPAGHESSESPRKKAGDFVLQTISPKNSELLQGVFEEAARAVRSVIEKVTPSGPDFTLESGS